MGQLSSLAKAEIELIINGEIKNIVVPIKETKIIGENIRISFKNDIIEINKLNNSINAGLNKLTIKTSIH